MYAWPQRWLFSLLLTTLVGCLATEDLDLPSDVEENSEENSAEEPIDDDESNQGDQDAGYDHDTIDGVEVYHPRELRGVWIPTVWNISWPSSSELSAAAQKNELIGLMETAKAAGLNTVFFQIRGEADAYYASEIEPWSRFLTGVMGQDPGYDPLEFAIVEAHKRGLELHVWMNPYRALTTADTDVASADHIVHAQDDIVVPYGSLYWMDPGLEAVRDQTLSVVEDVITRYDIDGLHFDDYFYPYPTEDPFPDATTYADYQADGGIMSLGDFRRNNVHLLVEAVQELVHEHRPDIRFGISPFGIYRPGIPPGIDGLDQYGAIYADPLRWLEEGWVDYLAPQLYWPTTQTAQAFEVLLDWWAARASEAAIDLFVGNYTAQLGSSSAWTVAEFLEQIRLTRAARDRRALGNIHYHIGPIASNRSGLTDALVDEYYGAPAATPPIPGVTHQPPMPELHIDDEGITFDNDGNLRYIAVYHEDDLLRLVPAAKGHFGLPIGDYHISLIDRFSRESLAVPVTITVDSDDSDDTNNPPAGQSCVHTFGGTYAHLGCSGAYQCCNGTWREGLDSCGECSCTETTGETGCSP